MITALTDKIIKIKPLVKTNSFITEANKDGATLFEGAKQEFLLPNNADGSWVAILDKEEQKYFEEQLGLSPNALTFNVTNKEQRNKSFWKNFGLKITSEGITLNLANPLDNLKWRIAKVSTKKIAPSWSEKDARGEYRFVILEEDVTNKETLNKTNLVKTAWIEYGKIEQNNAKMCNVLRLMDRRVAPDKENNTEFLQASLSDIISSNPKHFIDIVKDEDMDLKNFIDDCVQAGLIKRVAKHTYKFPEGDEKYTMDTLAVFLKDLENEFRYTKLKQQLKNSK